MPGVGRIRRRYRRKTSSQYLIGNDIFLVPVLDELNYRIKGRFREGHVSPLPGGSLMSNVDFQLMVNTEP